MADKRLDDSLREFIAEIRDLDIPAFVGTHRWRLHERISRTEWTSGMTLARFPIGRFSTISAADTGSSRCVPAMWWICRCSMAA